MIAVTDICRSLETLVSIIYGTVMAISRSMGEIDQRVFYNGHKWKHAIRFRGVTVPDGGILHACGPVEGRRHDWVPYLRSGLEETLHSLLTGTDGIRDSIYSDSGYSRRSFLHVPFQGSHLTSAQKESRQSMSHSRVTVEWGFRKLKLLWTTVDC